MGAWGSGIFDNDSGLDWLGTFSEKPTLAKIKSIFKKSLNFKDNDHTIYYDEALVAAEVVALIHGQGNL
jgi:Domain of unknown function (DUF4259)